MVRSGVNPKSLFIIEHDTRGDHKENQVVSINSSVLNSQFNLLVRQRAIEFTIQNADIVQYKADIIALKYAMALYGADRVIAEALGKSAGNMAELLPQLDNHIILYSKGEISASKALFLNIGNLFNFEYSEIRKFSTNILKILATETPTVKHIAMTIHGVGYGLDEVESFTEQLAGCVEALEAGIFPANLEHISIVEQHSKRAELLQQVLNNILPGGTFNLSNTKVKEKASHNLHLFSDINQEIFKPHIFVAMPLNGIMEDVFYYGIQGPVNSAGYLCEKANADIFTGDGFQRIKLRIDSATLVIAEITYPNPNVYLEIGYAWGRNRPTILLTQNEEMPPSNIYGHRCLKYKRIRELEEMLLHELQECSASGHINEYT